MLEVANRKEYGWLLVDNMKNFPCADLQLIDQLWLKFSGGRFGFSVQRKIWFEIGGTLEFDGDIDSACCAIERLSARVGFRVQVTDELYRSCSDPNFLKESREGCLPRSHYKWPNDAHENDYIYFPSLISRLTECYIPHSALLEGNKIISTKQ